MSGMVVVSVDPTNGPDRVDLESARMTSGEHCTHGTRHWSFGYDCVWLANRNAREPPRQAMSSASGTAVSILHGSSEIPLRDHLVELAHRHESFPSTSSNSRQIDSTIANR